MKLKFKAIDEKWKPIALAGCVCILFFVCLTHLGGILSSIASFLGIFKPIFLGAVIAYIINPAAVFFEESLAKFISRGKLRWIISVLITIVLVVALLSLLMASLIPQLFSSIGFLLDNMEQYLSNLDNFAVNASQPAADIINEYISELAGDNGLFDKFAEIISNNLKGLIKATSDVGTTAVNWLIGMVFAVYFLLAKEPILKITSKFMVLTLSPLNNYRTHLLLEKFNVIFSKYIVFELLDALIVGAANYVFMIAFGMPSPLFISVVVGVTNLIPTFGPIIGGGIGIFILLLMNPASVIPFLIFTCVIQTVDAYILKPKLFGGALNVPGVVILISIIVFGKLLGIVGMLLAIPFAAIFVYAYKELLVPRLELNRDLQKYYAELERVKHEEENK